MDAIITFPGGKRVNAAIGAHVFRTDQSLARGGDGSAPEPFDLFLASLATCAGAYILAFCEARGLPSEGIRLIQHHRFDDASHRLEQIELEVSLPDSFPEKYRSAVVRAAEGCKVKRTLAAPPEVRVTLAPATLPAGASSAPQTTECR